MTLLADMQQPIEAFLEEISGTVTYNGTDIAAKIRYLEDKKSSRGGGSVAMAELKVKRSLVAAPAYRDVVVADGETWHVQQTVRKTAVYHLLSLERDRRVPL